MLRRVPDPHHLLLPRSNTEEPSAQWAEIRWNRGWQRLTDIEQLLTQLNERVQEPVVWRSADAEDAPANYHLVDFALPTDKRDLSLLGSEAIQHLRAALDHMVYNAAWNNTGRRPERTQFPIIKSKEKWAEVRRREIQPLSAEQAEWIEEVQPFNGVSWTRDLQTLSNADKHRYALEISPGLRMTLDHEATFLDPADPNRVMIPAKTWEIVLYLIDGERRETAKPPLTNMFLGAAELINRFAEQGGARKIKILQAPGSIHS